MSDSTNDINWVLPPVNYIPDHEEPKSLRERAAERGIETSGEDIDALTGKRFGPHTIENEDDTLSSDD